MRTVALVLVCLIIAACGETSTLSGEYVCQDLMVEKFNFREGGKVYVTILNMGEMPGTFAVDEDKVEVNLNSGTLPGMVLTRKVDLSTKVKYVSGNFGMFKFSCAQR